ncbi:MAG: SagB/ThcOx family dehydrogenase [Candidatus Latescibacterota bacterium]|nr:MAG: SagB/ThcOx family dehydrogenase [Candidatus Latescibacterota bacterium]
MPSQPSIPGIVKLPTPSFDDGPPVAEVLRRRRSIRKYSNAPLTIAEVSQLLWAAQGVTDPKGGLRTAPSGGALYPLETYLIAARVAGVAPGVFRYSPSKHDLVGTLGGNKHDKLAAAALNQGCVRKSAAVIAFAAVYERMTDKYGKRGIQYVDNEVGLAAENVLLQATALGLGAVMVGAFEEHRVRRVLGISADEVPACLLAIGRPR